MLLLIQYPTLISGSGFDTEEQGIQTGEGDKEKESSRGWNNARVGIVHALNGNR
jgi:hypothetical protein